MFDFDKGTEVPSKYLGAEKKTAILYEGERYMLKLPHPLENKTVRQFEGQASYKNNQFSEHIGSSIFRACGIDAQETALGYFTDDAGKRKIVVGCKDFTQDGGTLYEFSALKNTVKHDKVLSENIEDVYEIIGNSPFITNQQAVIAGFWNMFVIDALLGNRDRHLGNWGLLEKHGEFKLAPVYDCGSSLDAWLEDEEMQKLMLTASPQIKNNSYNVRSCYSINGKRIFYHEIFKTPPDDLRAAIARIVPRIDMAQIHAIVDATPEMSDVRKQYLKQALDLRYREILLPALKRELAQEQKPSLMETLRENAERAKAHNQELPPPKGRNDFDR